MNPDEIRARIAALPGERLKNFDVYFCFKKSFYVRHFLNLTDEGIKEVLKILNSETPWNAELWYKEQGTTHYKYFFR